MLKIKLPNLTRLFILTCLVAGHVIWLLLIKSQMNPDVIFPSWLLSNSKNLVSEVLTMYPPLLFYVVNFVNNFTNNLFISTTAIQMFLVVILDLMLFYYLKKKFGFKFAIYGLVFYIPWQVFFRGNYLWHDFATIPFIVLSFFYFEKFISRPIRKYLLIASVALACGYLFKLTVVYIYALYFLWIIFITPKKVGAFLGNALILFSPLVAAISVNFLIVSTKSTFAFAFYWNIIMQIFIYPRLPALSRFISPNYYPVLALLATVCIVSSWVIWKYSKGSSMGKWFLFSFALVSLFNIFPRWSDFHVQPFLLPLTIVCINAVSLHRNLKHKLYFVALFSVIVFFSSIILGNRIITEKKSAGIAEPDHISKFAPHEQVGLINGRRVYLHDYALYDDKFSFDSGKRPMRYKQVILGLKDPDYFHHTTSWQLSLEYVESGHPDIVLIPYQIKNKIDLGNGLTGFEKFVLENYHRVGVIADYFVYTSNEAR